ncbi:MULTISPECIES: hypothetical protein [Chryseobacterium]|nr:MULTISPECIES: hypothetical protein [Chryseobacterium]MCS4301380.1 hypothetical protein [Chryseobacterium sp. BIGb0232]ROS19762.1 hypothetical protein EDF65_0456 [Chryseobacterium nakagawai]
MKNLIFLFLLSPLACMAQLNYKDLTFLANNKIDKNIKYIQNKGYTFRQEKVTGDGTKQVYYEKGKLSQTMVVMRILNNLSVVVSYVPENKNNFENIQNEVNKTGFNLIDSTSSDRDSCTSYQSKEYFTKLCEVQFPGSSEKSHNITFYRNDIASNN